METETPLPVQPEENPDSGPIHLLLQHVTGRPADYVDADLDRWADMARASGKAYADYGESLFIPGTGRIMRPWAGAPWSASQLARAYVDMQGWGWPPVRPSGWAWQRTPEGTIWAQSGPDSWGPVPPPAVHFRGPETGEWSYIDLVAAYWQIGSRLPWWVAKPGSRRVLRGRWARPEVLFPLRQVRLNLFGMLTYPGGGVTWVYPDGSSKTAECPAAHARMANPAWGTAVMRVVHAVAADLIRTFDDVPLWHTDGALVPRGREEEVIGWLFSRWGLTARVKELGEGTVAGAGNYSWRKSYNPQMPSSPYSNLSCPDVGADREWWLSYRGL